MDFLQKALNAIEAANQGTHDSELHVRDATLYVQMAQVEQLKRIADAGERIARELENLNRYGIAIIRGDA